MKKTFLSIILFFIIVPSVYGYVDMSNVKARANDLDMRAEDYTLAMALNGLLSGTMLGLFLWKTK